MPIRVFIFLAVASGALGLGGRVSDVQSIELTSTPSTQTPVSFTCQAVLVSNEDVREIRIERRTPIGYVWIARINSYGGIETNNNSFSFGHLELFDVMNVEGGLSQGAGASTIQLTWPTLSAQRLFGTYICTMFYHHAMVFRKTQSNALEFGSSYQLANALGNVDQTNGASTEVQESVNALTQQISDINDRVNTLSQTPDISAVTQRIDEMDQRISGLEVSSSSLSVGSGDIQEIRDQIATIDQTLQGTENLQQEIVTLREQIVSLQESAGETEELRSQISSMNDNIDVLTVDMQNLDTINERIDSLAQQQADSAAQSSPTNTCNYNIRKFVWPTGSYSLLMPRTGCPSNTLTEWARGIRTHNTVASSGNNQNSNSSADHLPEDLFTEVDGSYLARLRYCTHQAPRPGVVNWPSGSYCINRRIARCPAGFETGSIIIDDETPARRQQGNLRQGNTPAGRYNTNTLYYYCCRSDGPASTAIALPAGQPFILYRFQGECQQVEGMSVTNDYIVLDTADDRNSDSKTDISPDAQLNNLRFELCYYEPVP